MIYLDFEELLHIASRTLGEYKVRDYGLLNAALVRPQTHVFGHDAYPTLAEKAAALLYSLTMNYALIDRNKRLALAAVLAFCGVNGQRLALTNEQAYQLVMDVANGEMELPEITAMLRSGGLG